MGDEARGHDMLEASQALLPPPVEVQVIERLMSALELARLTSDPMLPRLIEAVLLHAGRELARTLCPSEPD